MSEAQVAGGHKANISNPNTSQESKEHSEQVLEQEFDGGDVPKAGEKADKNTGNVVGGHKANLTNPNTSQEAKENSKKVLESMDD